MQKIVLISCVSKKLSNRARAKDLYVSPLFCMNMRFAESMNPDKIFILSAKYGLVELEDVLEPYDETLNEKGQAENRAWAEHVLLQLRSKVDLEEDEITFLAGERYRRHLVQHCKRHSIPMEGLGIGRQLQFLKRQVT